MRRFLFAFSFLGFLSLALAKEVPFTQEDRDRRIRREVKVEEGQKALQVQINGLQKQIDGLQRQADGMGRVRGFVEGYPLEDWFSGTLTVVKELNLLKLFPFYRFCPQALSPFLPLEIWQFFCPI